MIPSSFFSLTITYLGSSTTLKKNTTYGISSERSHHPVINLVVGDNSHRQSNEVHSKGGCVFANTKLLQKLNINSTITDASECHDSPENIYSIK